MTAAMTSGGDGPGLTHEGRGALSDFGLEGGGFAPVRSSVKDRLPAERGARSRADPQTPRRVGRLHDRLRASWLAGLTGTGSQWFDGTGVPPRPGAGVQSSHAVSVAAPRPFKASVTAFVVRRIWVVMTATIASSSRSRAASSRARCSSETCRFLPECMRDRRR